MDDAATVNRERRDAEIARTGHKPMPSPFFFKVVGVTFVEHYPQNLHALAEAFERPPIMPYPNFGGEMAQYFAEKDWERAMEEHLDWSGPEKLPAILIRNPDNAYDSNAIEVHVPALGEQAMIGHVTRPIAARLAPDMDAGGRWLAQVESVLIDPDHPDRPGISIQCVRAEEE